MNYCIRRLYLQPQLKLLCHDTRILRNFSAKDVSLSAGGTSQDYLMMNLKSSVDTADVLKIIGNHYSIMNEKHVLQAFKSLFELKKSGHSKLSSEEIMNSPAFIKLCKRLKSEARGMSLNDTIEALKIVSYVGVPAKSIVIQILLQLIRQQVNDLSLQQIVFLDFLLKTFKKNPLSDALKIALPLVFEAQLRVKMDRDDAAHLSQLLKFASKRPVSNKSISLIIECLENLETDIDVNTAKNIIWALGDIKKSSPSHQVLLDICWNILATNINQMSYVEVESFVHVMLKKFAIKNTHFYHEEFLDSCVNFIVTSDCGFENGTWILKKLSKMGHVSFKLIDYLGEKIVSDPQVWKTCRPTSAISFVSGMACADYKPADWDRIQNIVLKNKIMEEKERMELPWIKWALHLLVLDIYPPDMICHIFGENFLNKFLSREYNFLDRLQLLLLYQAVKTLFLTYGGPFPSENLMNEIMTKNGEHIEEFPLQLALEQGFGGSTYVWTKLITKMGHFIDHLVVMRKGGYPVALNQISTNSSSKAYVEDIIVPSDAQMILILCFPESAYNRNCHRLRALPSLTIRTLEALGHIVVPISLQLWTSLPDFEKIPYLMQTIKVKCESLNVNEIRSAY